jgi:hypothetical protein
MRSAGNFSAEWGYLAPAPSFARTARVVLVATAIGAIAGAGVVFSLVERPAEPEKTSLAARAIVTSVRATAIPSPALAANGPALTGGPASATLPRSPAPAATTPRAANLEPARPAVAMTMPPTPPQPPASTIAPPIAASAPIATPAPARPAPTRPVSLTRSLAAHPPGAASGLAASVPVLRGRSVAVNAPAGPAAAPAAALASADPAAAMPAASASVSDVAAASPTAASGTGAGEAPAVVPIGPTDANGNPSIIGPETIAPKKDKHHASGKKQFHGIGTILRRFFVAHSGRTYYPKSGLSN